MTLAGWAEILLAIGLSVAMGWPMGVYLSRVWSGESTWLDPVMAPVERLFYRAAGVDPDHGQGWFDYAMALLVFNAAGFLLLYGLLRLQGPLPFNPQGVPGLRPDLAFNTAMSFVTNTDWQSYPGETTVSHLSQMAGLTVQNFVSAGSGAAVAAALSRAFTVNRGRAIGNFWRDLVRIELYLFLPLAILFTVILVALGLPQTLAAQVHAHTLEGALQTLTLGPMASQQAINQLGANGGGFVNANAAHPFENPSGVSNLLQTALMDAIGFACVVAFGRTLKTPSDTRALAMVMVLFCTVAAGVIYAAECQPTPALAGVHAPHAANMEGKETRFGIPASAAFAAMTTSSSTGSMNSAHESLTPAAGGMTLFMMQLGEMAPGGAGAGLYGMINLALLAVFVAGLLVGRTPEYLGKKIEAREIKLVLLAMILVSASSLGLTAISLVLPGALRSLSASGPHGLTEMLYAYTSSAANNGSAFSGLQADTPLLNITLALAMACGRFGYILPVLAMVGGLAAKPKLGLTHGTFPTDGPLFMGLLSAVILIMAGLQFFPAQALGPIVEQFQMMAMTRR